MAEARTCPVCGAEFEPRTWNQRFCGDYRGRCYRRAMNVAQRGGDLTAPLPAPFNCAECGKRCVPGRRGVAPHASKFCGTRCKRRWHKAREPLGGTRSSSAPGTLEGCLSEQVRIDNFAGEGCE